MKLVNYLHNGATRVGFLIDDMVIDLKVCAEQVSREKGRTLEEQPIPRAILDLGDSSKLSMAKEAYGYAEEHSQMLAATRLEETKLLPLVERPGNAFCIDGNYPIHNLWEDKKLPLPTDFSHYAPAMYLRPSSSVIGHGGTTHLPEFVEKAGPPPSSAWSLEKRHDMSGARTLPNTYLDTPSRSMVART